MVKGLDLFTDYFRDHANKYIIIGGTACDMIMEKAGLSFRVTDDIDLILIVEAIGAEFVRSFWGFIRAGGYGYREQSTKERKHYRFRGPADSRFPQQLELFARRPDLITLDDNVHLTPIPASEDLSSLSAILLNDEYYEYVLKNSAEENGLHRANMNALICLKAKAFLEMTERKLKGEKVDSLEIKKHRNDVFKLTALVSGTASFDLPAAIMHDMHMFADAVSVDLPDKVIYKEISDRIDSKLVFSQLIKAYHL
jgi:hypothetical protein